MPLLAKVIYHALLWREQRRAQRGEGARAGSAPHLETGRRGETLAYWYLRQAGYTVVARNRRSGHGAGELDMVAWDGPILAFVEVKTRTSTEAGPPEAAVSPVKQRRVSETAKEYRRRLRLGTVAYRFDIVSVLWTAGSSCDLRLIKDAFKD